MGKLGRLRVLRDAEAAIEMRDSLPHDINVGFVPTMGSLHAGHEALIRASVRETDVTIVSIFVNPLQFASGEDLASYPRQEAADFSICEALRVRAVFAPNNVTAGGHTHMKANENADADADTDADSDANAGVDGSTNTKKVMETESGTGTVAMQALFGVGFDTTVRVGTGDAERNEASEGASRPSFFTGVATVLARLFSVIRPSWVYFGQKDAQQVAVVHCLLRDLFPRTRLRVIPTVRHPDGLAYSSRNSYLTNSQRQTAPLLFAALRRAKERFEDGLKNPDQLCAIVSEFIRPQPALRLLYVGICHRWSFRQLQEDTIPRSMPCLLCVAATIGRTRLIDNIVLQE